MKNVERNICNGSFEGIVCVIGQRRSPTPVLDGSRAEGEGDWLRIWGGGGGVSGRLWSLWDVLEREGPAQGGTKEAKLGLAAGVLRKQMGEKFECV